MKPEIKLTNRLFIDYGEAIEEVLRRAVHHALLMHKRAGNPIAVWKDGEVVIVPAHEITIRVSDEGGS